MCIQYVNSYDRIKCLVRECEVNGLPRFWYKQLGNLQDRKSARKSLIVQKMVLGELVPYVKNNKDSYRLNAYSNDNNATGNLLH